MCDKLLKIIMLSTLFGGAILAQSVPTTAPAPNPNLTPPGPQKHEPPARQSPSSPISRAPQEIMRAPGQGVIAGYVYWDATAVSHNPSANCSGISITVNVASGGTSQFTPLGTYNNNFTYMPNVGTAGVCAYAIHQMPVGQDMQVQVNVASSMAFSPAVVPVSSNIPTKIIGGQCNNLPPAVPTLSVLSSNPWTCGNYAYNVNFALRPAARILGASGGGMLSGSVRVAKDPGPIQSGAAATPSAGMLATGGSAPSTAPVRGQKALTNSDVIQMVKGGVPESVIISSIRSAQGKFDTSAQGCRALQQGHVSQNVLNAMGDGSVRTCYTGGVRVSTKLAAPKQGTRITNPNASATNNAIIAVLLKQRQAADAEATAMKLGLRVGTPQAQPSTVMSAGSGGPIASSSTRGVMPVNAIPPNTGSNTSTSPYAKLPANLLQTLALTCGHDPTMRIINVSGGPSPAIFTQDSKYNFYTITGCSFGDPGPNAKVYIYYQGTFHEDFQVQQWNDNGIQISLDQNLRGVDDQNNLTLVVQRQDGKQAIKAGYKFYAARDTILLGMIPKQYFSLDRFRPDSATTNSWNPIYTSASSPSVQPNLSNVSAEVHWDATPDPNGTLVGGSDLYDFSHLHSTFALDSTSMEWLDVACNDPSYDKLTTSTNNWGIDWSGASGVRVTWQGQRCDPHPGSCGGAFQPDCFAGAVSSNYGVNVWVSGPRGLDPWTGKPSGH